MRERERKRERDQSCSGEEWLVPDVGTVESPSAVQPLQSSGSRRNTKRHHGVRGNAGRFTRAELPPLARRLLAAQ